MIKNFKEFLNESKKISKSDLIKGLKKLEQEDAWEFSEILNNFGESGEIDLDDVRYKYEVSEILYYGSKKENKKTIIPEEELEELIDGDYEKIDATVILTIEGHEIFINVQWQYLEGIYDWEFPKK